MRKIYTAKNPIDAHLLRGALESENIQAIVQGEFLWTARGELPITPETSPSVWIVNDEDNEKALQIVESFSSQEVSLDTEAGEWKCAKCNETNEGQFQECWNCGAPRKNNA